MTSKHYFQNCSRKIREIYVSQDCSTENQLLLVAFLYLFPCDMCQNCKEQMLGGYKRAEPETSGL